MRTLALLLLLSLAAPAFASGSVELLRDLSSPAARVRERALQDLRDAESLGDEAVREALSSASPHARSLMLEIVAARGMHGLVPDVASALRHADPVVWEAAVRALVALGDAAVERGVTSLADTETAPAAETEARQARLRALHAQAAIERDLMTRWMRKSGSYDGRFAFLEKRGWPVQPVLLAMLLDVPLEDRFVVLPETESDVLSLVQRMEALDAVARSARRGYRTFEPLPVEVDAEELFDLAAQALADVADVDVMGEILENLALRLDAADRAAGWQLRPVERAYAETLEEILASRGRPELLAKRVRQLARTAALQRSWVERAGPRQRSEAMQHLSTDLGQLARALYRMRRFDEAAEVYGEALDIMLEVGGRPSPVTAYNRACSLARGGRIDEAFTQLDAALGIQDASSDLTRDWVEEDGDLRDLHDDPRWKQILDRHFGKSD